MKDEAKCNCQHCNGHIAFPAEMAGQMFECPNCKLETLLFIPPAGKPAHQSAPAKKRISLVWWIIGGAALAILLFLASFALLQVSPKQTKQTTFEPTRSAAEQPNLKPVEGAFGYNLGDKVSEGKDIDFDFIRLQDTPPFDHFSIDRTSDGRVCQINAYGEVGESEAYEYKKRLIAVLTEKYGARGETLSEKYAVKFGNENYYFGTVGRVAYLAITDIPTNTTATFRLLYYDEKLLKIFLDEQSVIRQKDEEDKKAALKKGL